MRLRKLELKDAELMNEWMHDKNVVENLRTDFMSKTISDCEEFIKNSWEDAMNLNLAIVDEKDVYMGTVSLKNIKDKSAEFGITIRKCAMGRGIAQKAMKEIFYKGFSEMGLKKIYWCVSDQNKRALRFYDKNGYKRVDCEVVKDLVCGYDSEQINSYVWFLE